MGGRWARSAASRRVVRRRPAKTASVPMPEPGAVPAGLTVKAPSFSSSCHVPIISRLRGPAAAAGARRGACLDMSGEVSAVAIQVAERSATRREVGARQCAEPPSQRLASRMNLEA